MAKFYGKIGFEDTVELDPQGRPGIWKECVVEKPYYGDVVRDTRRYSQSSTNVNDDVKISNQFSILADPYAFDNISSMRYITFMNSKWRITDVEVQYPRLVISVGGLWNEH